MKPTPTEGEQMLERIRLRAASRPFPGLSASQRREAELRNNVARLHVIVFHLLEKAGGSVSIPGETVRELAGSGRQFRVDVEKDGALRLAVLAEVKP